MEIISNDFIMVLLDSKYMFVQTWQVYWQETLRGHVAGILTTQRVLIVSAAFDILAGTSTNFDKGLPSISFDFFFQLKSRSHLFLTLD